MQFFYQLIVSRGKIILYLVGLALQILFIGELTFALASISRLKGFIRLFC